MNTKNILKRITQKYIDDTGKTIQGIKSVDIINEKTFSVSEELKETQKAKLELENGESFIITIEKNNG